MASLVRDPGQGMGETGVFVVVEAFGVVAVIAGGLIRVVDAREIVVGIVAIAITPPAGSVTVAMWPEML